LVCENDSFSFQLSIFGDNVEDKGLIGEVLEGAAQPLSELEAGGSAVDAIKFSGGTAASDGLARDFLAACGCAGSGDFFALEARGFALSFGSHD